MNENREKVILPEVCKTYDCPFNQVEWGKLCQTVADIKEMVQINRADREKDIEEVKKEILNLKIELKSRDTNFEERLSKLERWKYYIFGFAAAITIFMNWLMPHITQALDKI